MFNCQISKKSAGGYLVNSVSEYPMRYRNNKPLRATAGMTSDIRGLIVLLWAVAGRSRWS